MATGAQPNHLELLAQVFATHAGAFQNQGHPGTADEATRLTLERILAQSQQLTGLSLPGLPSGTHASPGPSRALFTHAATGEPIAICLATHLPASVTAELSQTIAAHGGSMHAKVSRASLLLVDAGNPKGTALRDRNAGRENLDILPWHWVRAAVQRGRLVKKNEVLPQTLFVAQDGAPLPVHVDESVQGTERLELEEMLYLNGADLSAREDCSIFITSDATHASAAAHLEVDDPELIVKPVSWARLCVARGVLTLTDAPAEPRAPRPMVVDEDGTVIKNRGGRKAGEPRNEYTEEEDQHLVEYLAKVNPKLRNRSGFKIYRALEANPEMYPWAQAHSAQSWVNHYRHHQADFTRRINEYIKMERQRRRAAGETLTDEESDYEAPPPNPPGSKKRIRPNDKFVEVDPAAPAKRRRKKSSPPPEGADEHGAQTIFTPEDDEALARVASLNPGLDIPSLADILSRETNRHTPSVWASRLASTAPDPDESELGEAYALVAKVALAAEKARLEQEAAAAAAGYGGGEEDDDEDEDEDEDDEEDEGGVGVGRSFLIHPELAGEGVHHHHHHHSHEPGGGHAHHHLGEPEGGA